MAGQRVFISHTVDEADVAAIVKQALCSQFLGTDDVYVSSDGSSVRLGELWLADLTKVLKSARVFLILCSPQSVTRPWVNFEAGAGWVGKKVVIPLCHSGMTPGALPAPLNALQGVDLAQESGVRQLFAQIAQHLQVPPPAPIDAAVAGLRSEMARFHEAGGGVKRLHLPKILCVSTPQYAESAMGFPEEIDLIRESFRGCVKTKVVRSSAEFEDVLRSSEIDILHLCLAVHFASGDLVFSEVDPGAVDDHDPNMSSADLLPASAVVELVSDAGLSLVMLSTCRGSALAIELYRTVSVIATSIALDSRQGPSWAGAFYRSLAVGWPASKAASYATTSTKVPMKPMLLEDFVAVPPGHS